MVKVNIERRLEPIDVSIEIEIDVANYGEVVRENAGAAASFFSRFGPVRKRVDSEIRQQTLTALNEGLDAQLRTEVLAGIESGARQAIDDELNRRLKESGVEASARVSAQAR